MSVVADAAAPMPGHAVEETSIDMRAAVIELDRLKKLNQDGVLTQQQFDGLKTMLLRRVV
jgi:hypothetical protein